MYLSHFGFDEYPFSLTPDTDFFFESASHPDALNVLHAALRSDMLPRSNPSPENSFEISCRFDSAVASIGALNSAGKGKTSGPVRYWNPKRNRDWPARRRRN